MGGLVAAKISKFSKQLDDNPNAKKDRQAMAALSKQLVEEVNSEVLAPLWTLDEAERQRQLARTHYCFRHRGNCVVLNAATPGSFALDISGNGMQFLGSSSLPWFCWAREIILCQPGCFVLENVQPFQHELAELVFMPGYGVTVFPLSPDDLGVPATRARKFMTFVQRDAWQWSPDVATSPADALLQLFKGACHLQGETFWCAPSEVVDAEHQKWADRKGLGRRLDGKSWKTKQLMTSASRERLRKWEDNARTANVSPHVIMNTTQATERWMAGNSMSLPCLGALLLFQLAFLQPQPSTLTTPEAPPAASVAPAVVRENETQLDFEETQCACLTESYCCILLQRPGVTCLQVLLEECGGVTVTVATRLGALWPSASKEGKGPAKEKAISRQQRWWCKRTEDGPNKKCATCKKKKPVSDFHQQQGTCKPCWNAIRGLKRFAKAQGQEVRLKALSETEHTDLVKAYSKEHERATKERSRVKFSIAAYKEATVEQDGVRFKARRRLMTEKVFIEHAQTTEGGDLTKSQAEQKWQEMLGDPKTLKVGEGKAVKCAVVVCTDIVDYSDMANRREVERQQRLSAKMLMRWCCPARARTSALETLEGEETLLEKATTLGMPFKINSKTAWCNFRQLHFRLLRYGGSKVLNDHGTAEGWKTLLRHVVSQKAAKAAADDKVIKLCWTRDADMAYKAPRALKLYRECPRV
ncbi:unnamed protein product [Effrenium voratum]|uniref:Uncharacterized protein n=1 Tax=Effrenium voratum TaxID=2562239 RepID=A0AA36J972_9DINO|nr:unnamed protein product [Effrenium voratum]